MSTSFSIKIQHWLPQRGLSIFAGKVAYCRWSWVKNPLIHWFMKRYGVSLQGSEIQQVSEFKHFNDFFTRRLKPAARPIGENVVSPCDGCVSQVGRIQNDTVIQAKGKTYSVTALLGGVEHVFEGGLFGTFYLAPKDYHRVHMPLAGTLTSMTYIPGTLFSVNALTAEQVPDLFAKNERLVCWFDTELGLMAVILVGAMIVGSMATPWAGTVTPHAFESQTWHYFNEAPTLQKGDEMGLFHLGSTVIILLPAGVGDWIVSPGDTLQMGQKLISRMPKEASNPE
jgi:phosphatidylserine decarboxylase